MNWQIERFRSFDAMAAVLADWEALASQIRPWTPFTTPAWNRLWWKHYRKRMLVMTDEFFVHTLRDRDNRLVAVAPLLRRRIPGFGSTSLHTIDFFGADQTITEIRGLVSLPSDQAAALLRLREFLRAGDCSWDLLTWHGMRAESLHTIKSSNDKAAVLAEPSDYLVALPKTWKDLLGGVSANMRKSVRKSYQSLERHGHGFKFQFAESTGGKDGPMDTFYRLHSARAAVEDMQYKHPDRFADARNRGFLSEFSVEMAKTGNLRIFELEVAGETIASRLAFLHQGELYLYYSGYDPKWRKYAIMTLLMAEIFQWAIKEKLTTVNLSTGNDLSKLRWQPTEIELYGSQERRTGLRGQVLRHSVGAIARARAAIVRARGYRSGAVVPGQIERAE